jgi:hypothetical protein
MSIPYIIALIAGAAATALFVAGYYRGTRNAIRNNHNNTVAAADDGSSYGWLIALAVIASTLVIYFMGVSGAFLYIGPFLAIGTAAVNGFAFFYDKAG